MVVICNNILFLFLPVKLFTLEIPNFWDLGAFILESLMGKIINRLNIKHGILSLGFGVVINFKWALGPQKVWIGVIMVRIWYILPFKGQPDHVLNITDLALGSTILECCSCEFTLFHCIWPCRIRSVLVTAIYLRDLGATIPFNIPKSIWGILVCKHVIISFQDGHLCFRLFKFISHHT